MRAGDSELWVEEFPWDHLHAWCGQWAPTGADSGELADQMWEYLRAMDAEDAERLMEDGWMAVYKRMTFEEMEGK